MLSAELMQENPPHIYRSSVLYKLFKFWGGTLKTEELIHTLLWVPDHSYLSQGRGKPPNASSVSLRMLLCCWKNAQISKDPSSTLVVISLEQRLQEMNLGNAGYK